MSDPTEPPATPASPVGLRCWRCGHQQFRVVYTRRRLDGLWRRRECLRCGTRFTTCERRLGA
jgi:transcriptional regulator NrdR family protein